jgi:hypothetical protein
MYIEDNPLQSLPEITTSIQQEPLLSGGKNEEAGEEGGVRVEKLLLMKRRRANVVQWPKTVMTFHQL